MSGDVPKKLKHDAIIDASFEIRFDAGSAAVPEVIFGRLADMPAWKGFAQRRLPTADIPAAIRRVDPNLRYQPSIELIDPKAGKTIRIGPQSLSYSATPPYPGWDVFGPQVKYLAEALFSTMPEVSVTRLGLRYVNGLRSDLHGISTVENLNLKIEVGELALSKNLNLNYTVSISSDTSCTVRIATRDFVQGPLADEVTLLADLDVFTVEPFESKDVGQIRAWVEAAHDSEKKLFFGMLTAQTIAALKVS